MASSPAVTQPVFRGRVAIGRRLCAFLAAVMVAGGGLGCVSVPAPLARSARLVHVVFFELNDPADAAALRRDCDRLLQPISVIHGYSIGEHFDTGRDSVLADFDLALVVRFLDEVDYREYLEHPAHLELVDVWRPRARGLRVHDFWDVAR
ncbi:MAG: hypothetical protein DHS20C15_21700 [Planctomycetota bacterium]|nr:MAG: hypothetical protein DHS20C15_21700 [Planctomycetota bacterium]